jgi:hypothetical protein
LQPQEPGLLLVTYFASITSSILSQTALYFTTKFTNFPGTTIVFTTSLPANNSAIRESARAAVMIVA